MTIEVIKDLVEVMESAINSGDWKVDGACDPTMVLIRAKKHIEESKYVYGWPLGKDPREMTNVELISSLRSKE